MGGELHEISLAIGKLQQSAENSTRVQEAIFRKLDDMSKQIQGLPSLAQTVAELKPEVEKAKKDRWLRIGLAAGAGIGGLGGIAGMISAFKEFILGSH